MLKKDEKKDRLERYLAYKGLASRREAKNLIRSGGVVVNGAIITEPGFGVTETDTISVSTLPSKEAYLLFKPRGIETSKTKTGSVDIHDRFASLRHLAPVGRLDKESEGLIILTNDGTITKALTSNSSIGKTYRVTVRENISDQMIQRMISGIILDGIKTKPAIVKRVSRMVIDITLYEGRKHQIRRMCDACKLTIVSLVRISIGSISCGSMKSGSIRKLSKKEIEMLKK